MGIEERFQGANRVDAGKLSPYWGEHVARYAFSLPYIKGERVLDIACGTGYGIAFLQKEAKFTVGVDVDRPAVRKALSECSELAAVVLGNGLTLPFADEAFAHITSFETLEHLHDRREFLMELKRVLHPNGLLILSTPNANYTQPSNGKPLNPYHVFEYTPEELGRELEVFFDIEVFCGQALNPRFGIPPFYDAQRRLSKDVWTQTRLMAWKIINRMPIALRERVSALMWGRPFYPVEGDYLFSDDIVHSAPVLVAVCRKTR